MKAGPCTNEEYITSIQSSKVKGVELVQKRTLSSLKHKMKKKNIYLLYAAQGIPVYA